MKKNRTIVFLLFVFTLLISLFVYMYVNTKNLSYKEVLSKAKEDCKHDNYKDAYNFLNQELEDNPSISEGKPGREELEKMRDRVKKCL